MPLLEAAAVTRANDEIAPCYLNPNIASAIEAKPASFWSAFQRELAASPVLGTPARLVRSGDDFIIEEGKANGGT